MKHRFILALRRRVFQSCLRDCCISTVVRSCSTEGSFTPAAGPSCFEGFLAAGSWGAKQSREHSLTCWISLTEGHFHWPHTSPFLKCSSQSLVANSLCGLPAFPLRLMLRQLELQWNSGAWRVEKEAAFLCYNVAGGGEVGVT